MNCHFCDEKLTEINHETSDQGFDVCFDCMFEIDDEYDDEGKPLNQN